MFHAINLLFEESLRLCCAHAYFLFPHTICRVLISPQATVQCIAVQHAGDDDQSASVARIRVPRNGLLLYTPNRFQISTRRRIEMLCQEKEDNALLTIFH